MPDSPKTAEDLEFAEADVILEELRRSDDAGNSKSLCGECIDRYWDKDGVLHVAREYSVDEHSSMAPRLLLRETPYSAHPQSGTGGTGGVVWPGAVALSTLLYRRRVELLMDVHDVLEIGAGCGLPGLSVAAILSERSDGGARCRVALTDESDMVVANLKHEVEENASRLGAVRLDTLRLEWKSFLDGVTEVDIEAVDLLIGSDVIWGDRAPLVAFMALRLVRPGGCLIISAQQGREGLATFEELIRAGGDGTHKLPEDPIGFDVDVSRQEIAGECMVLYVCKRRRHP